MTTRTKTPEALREQAEKLAEQAAAVQAELDAHSLREWEREQAEQREADEQLVKSFNRAELDQAVEDARQAFEDVVADHPLTQALAAYQAAGYRRNWAYADTNGARSRLGMEGMGTGPGFFPPTIGDAIDATAARLAQAQIDASRSQA